MPRWGCKPKPPKIPSCQIHAKFLQYSRDFISRPHRSPLVSLIALQSMIVIEKNIIGTRLGHSTTINRIANPSGRSTIDKDGR